MKKNKMMRLSALLLVAVLLTTCVISGTWAKYITTDTASDSATVAAWGITLTVEGDDVLYDDDKSTTETAIKVSTNALAAPGTYQKLATVALTGTPEVAYEITVNVDLELANWEVESAVYCPVVFTVDGAEIKIDATNTTTELLEEAIEVAIIKAITGGSGSAKVAEGTGYKCTAQYSAGAAVPASANEVLIDWAWAFNGEDAKDTALGNAATKATIGFSLTVTVDQID